MLLLLLILPIVLAAISWFFYVRTNSLVWLSIRDDRLLQMSKMDTNSDLYAEMALKAVEADNKARNVWREDLDEWRAAVARSQEQIAAQKRRERVVSQEMDRARIAYMEHGLTQLQDKIINRAKELEAAGEPTMTYSIDGDYLTLVPLYLDKES